MRIKSAENRITETRKGFTMVELIVVLVVLAIIAAFIIPALLGFIDKGKESEYKAHAEAALAATQTALSDLYNDASSSYTPVKRENTRKLAGADETSAFTVWTDDVLWDGRTAALEENISSYTIIKALYKENDNVYMYYDGKDWTKYDSETKAMEAAVGIGVDGKLKSVGNNIIYVWPYQRDFAYLEGETEYHGSDTEGPEIKVVTFHTVEKYASRSFFKRVGKGGSGKESVKVVFWKEGDEYKSYWDGQYFVENENYKYEFDAGKGMELQGWVPRLYAVQNPFKTPDDVINYIYNIETDKNEFDLDAVLLDREGWAEKVILSKSAFGSFCVGKAVNGMKKVAGDKYTKETIISVNGAVRVDDGSEENAVLYAWLDESSGVINWWTNADNAYMPADCSGFFAENSDIVSLDFTGFQGSDITAAGSMFSGCTGLTDITLGGGFAGAKISDTSKMFEGCENLSSVDMENIGTSGLTNVVYMFAGCSSLTSIALSDSFDISLVESLEGMFENCTSLTTLEIGGWNTSNVTSLEKTFKGCTSLGTVDMSSWNLGKVISLKETFSGLTNLTTLNMGNGWNLSSCTSLKNTFYGCTSLSSMDMSKLGLSSTLSNMSGTFSECTQIASIIFPSDFDTTNVTDMSYLFNNCSSVKILDLNSFNTASVTDFDHMFNGMSALTTIYATDGFVVVPTDSMFEGDTLLSGGRTKYEAVVTSGDTGYASSKYAWIDGRDGRQGYIYGKYYEVYVDNVAFKNLFNNEVRAMEKVSNDAYTLETLPAKKTRIDDTAEPDSCIYAWIDNKTLKWWTNADVVYFHKDCNNLVSGKTKLYSFSFEGFDTSKIENMSYMFSGCTNLSSVTFGNEEVFASVTDMNHAFNKCGNITTLDLSSWNTENATDINYIFSECKKLSSITFGNKEVFASVTDMNHAFNYCQNISELDLSSWNVKSVTDFQNTFDYCTSLNTITFGEWYNNQPLNIHNMFSRCYALENVDFSQLHFLNVTDAGSLFKQSITQYGISVDLSNIRTDNCKDFQQMFYECKAVTEIDITGWRVSNATDVHSMFYKNPKLKTIYIDQDFVFKSGANKTTMFDDDTAIVGGQGTTFIPKSVTAYNNQYIYARIDDPTNGKKGYFTYKAPKPKP